jgi:hypothetical protein
MLLLLQENETESHVLTPRIPTELVSGDLDGDGNDDVVMTFANSLDLLELTGSGTPGGPYFDPVNDSALIDTTPADTTVGVGGQGRGAIADVNGDSLPDFGFPSVALAGVVLIDGESFGPLPAVGALRTIDPESVTGCVSNDSNDDDHGYYRVTFELEYPDLPATAAYWQLAIWDVLPSSGVTPQAICTTTVPVDMTDGGQVITFYLVPDESWATSSEGELDTLLGWWVTDERAFCLRIQPVDQELVARGPSVVALAFLDYLVSMDDMPHEELVHAFLDDSDDRWSVPVGVTQHDACSAMASTPPGSLPTPLFGYSATPVYTSSASPTLVFLPAKRLPQPSLGVQLTLGSECSTAVHDG